MYTSVRGVSSGERTLWTRGRYGVAMRWNDLFADLEAQADAVGHAQFDADVRDMTRSERASIELASRLMHARGTSVTVTLLDGDTAQGVLVDAAAGWVLLGASGPQTLVPLSAVALVSGLGPRTAELSEVDRRLGIGHALRALARDRARVVVTTAAGQTSGVIGAVGADYVEVSTAVGAAVVVPLAAIMSVRSATA